MDRVIDWSLLAPRRVVGVAVVFLVCAAVFGVGVADHLSAGGFQDESAESSRAAALLATTFDRAALQLVLTVTSDSGVQSAEARATGSEIVRALTESPDVSDVTSTWTTTASAAATLTSRDGRTGLVIAGIRGDDAHGYRQAAALADRFAGDRDGVTVRAGGAAAAYDQINKQTQHDLVIIEAIAIPLSFLALACVFGGLLAAALPLVVGVLAIAGALATLRVVTFFADVSTFALNITAALAMALAIDYTLLIVTRFRDQLAAGDDRTVALSRTMCTAGRTVLFSALTVASSILALLLFPMPFLRSFAYAGVAAVAFAALAAVVVTPATIMLLGDRIDSYDVRRFVRRLLRRPEPMPIAPQQSRWYRFTRAVMRRPVATGSAVIALLLVLGAPFLGVRWGFPDERVLPDSASARQVGDVLRTDFTVDPATALTIVVPDASGLTPADFAGYAAQVSRAPDVASVSSPLATYVDGAVVGGPSAPSDIRHGSAYLTVRSTANGPAASDGQLTALHAIGGPGGKPIEIGGLAQINRDTAAAVTSRLPLVLAAVALITFVVMFLVTGSLVLPVKALVLNALSLTATFGALVWVFQEGHLGGLGTSPTGALVASVPVLLFCIAFGLSMDYEVFLMSRIREFWVLSNRTVADNEESVALGLTYTGRVVTAAAVLMAVSFTALAAADVSIIRMFGVGLTLAVLMDATLVRMVLLPAFMSVLGRANWYVPQRLARLHARIERRGGRARQTGDVPFLDGNASPAKPLGRT